MVIASSKYINPGLVFFLYYEVVERNDLKIFPINLARLLSSVYSEPTGVRNKYIRLINLFLTSFYISLTTITHL